MGTIRRSTYRRRQVFGVADSRAFHDGINAVCRDILKCLDRAVRPANFHRFHFLGRSQAEMKTQIVLREIACAPVDLAELLNARGANGYARADRRAIALRANELEQNAMKSARVHILEKRGCLANVEQENVDVACVEDVAKGSAAPGFQRQFLQACL